MPNVMGREFPYTPEGIAAAERYRQAVGMRNGGMMGFRPLGYADGDLVAPLVAPRVDHRPAASMMGAPPDATKIERTMGLGAEGAAAGAAGAAFADHFQRGVSNVMGAPVDAVNYGLGATGVPVSDTPVGGSESVSNAIDTIRSLVQEFLAQDIPDPVKAAVNAAIGVYGIHIDLVTSALDALGLSVSETPFGGSTHLKETFGFDLPPPAPVGTFPAPVGTNVDPGGLLPAPPGMRNGGIMTLRRY